MNRKELKQAGKNLFQKNYWYSVLVAFLMIFTGTCGSPSFNFSFNTEISGSSEHSIDVFEGSGETANTFFEEFFLFDKNFLEELITRPFAIAFFVILISAIVVGSVLGYFIFTSFRCGGIRYFLKSRKNQPAEIKEVFENLKDKTNINIAKVTFSRDLSVFLWLLLFIVPGFIKIYEYWAIDYILAVRPDIDKNEAKRLSKILMDGNKAELFVLGLSFLGWDLLTIFTMGLLNIFYVNPYKQATFVEFFSQIRAEALAKGTITPYDIPDYEFIDPMAQYQQQVYQQPKNIVYRPDGMPMGNTVYTQQPFQQPQNYVYKPDGTPISSAFYTQSVQQPNQQPVSQPTEPVVEEEEAPSVEENNPENDII